MVFELSIDIDYELLRLIGKSNIIVPKPILNEIELISKKGRDKKKKLANLSLRLIKDKYKIIDLNIDKKGDDALIDYATKLSGIVVTNDKALKKRLRDRKITVIYVRGKNRLYLEGNCY